VCFKVKAFFLFFFFFFLFLVKKGLSFEEPLADLESPFTELR